jgi:hypothetical protein
MEENDIMKKYIRKIKSRKLLIISMLSIIITCIQLLTLNIATAAEHKEFDTESIEKQLIIPLDKMDVIEVEFESGKELEIIFMVQEKNGLPVDIWFVNEDNYLLLSGGAQFLYYMDGSASQVSYAKRIVTLTEPDNYKLVITNFYNEQSVEINIGMEIRMLKESSNENSADEDPITSTIFYPLIIVLVIIIVSFIFLAKKFRNLKRANSVDTLMSSNANSRKTKNTKNSNKIQSKKLEFTRKNETKLINKTKKPKKTGVIHNEVIPVKVSTRKKHSVPQISITPNPDNNPQFCGQCGKPINTPFCMYCGSEVQLKVSV